MNALSEIISSLRRHGVSVSHLRVDGLPHILAGYGGETYLIAMRDENSYPLQEFVSRWKGRKIYIVSTASEALAVCGVGSKWIAWRIERENKIIQAVQSAIRYKGSSRVSAKDVFPWQDIYSSERALRRFMADMAERQLLGRSSPKAYTVQQN